MKPGNSVEEKTLMTGNDEREGHCGIKRCTSTSGRPGRPERANRSWEVMDERRE
jgi:hypothetical protein